jgi:hypothetical protein
MDILQLREYRIARGANRDLPAEFHLFYRHDQRRLL